MSTFHMQYVPHALVPAYEALGWKALGLTPGHHGIYAQTMRWDGEGDPPSPQSNGLKSASGTLNTNGESNVG